MPYRITAIEAIGRLDKDERTLEFQRSETVVADLINGELHFIMRLTGTSETVRRMFFVEVYLENNQAVVINPTKEHFIEEKKGANNSLSTSMCTFALQRLNWLMEALTSIERSAFKRTPLTRQVARAKGYPRESWEIILRPKYAKGVPSNREIFADVMRTAHAVRAHKRSEHLRMNPRTGVKDIIVSAAEVGPHVRGKGELVQLKDYRIEGVDKK